MTAPTRQRVWFVVYVRDMTRNVYVFAHRFADRSEAEEYREMYWWKGRPARIVEQRAHARPLLIKQPVRNAAREHREQQAQAMIVRADALKRYKTPG